MRFLRREIPVEGRDFCDMSGDYTKSLNDFSIINIMLPSRFAFHGLVDPSLPCMLRIETIKELLRGIFVGWIY